MIVRVRLKVFIFQKGPEHENHVTECAYDLRGDNRNKVKEKLKNILPTNYGARKF